MRLNEKILAWGIIVFILAAWALSYKFSWIIYFLEIFIIIFMLFFLVNEIIFLKRNNSAKEERLAIEVPYYGHLVWILYIFNVLMHINKDSMSELLVEIFIIIVAAIDIPINYKNNSKIYIYKEGMLLVRSIIMLDKIIPYSEIRKLKFIEYKRNKFLLEVQLEKSFKEEVYKYKINKRDKEEILKFITEVFDKEKITKTKEYKEDTLW